MKSGWKLLFTIFFLFTLTVWLAVFLYPKSLLKIIACDVGQGDAFLVYYKTTQILIGGGPNSKVLECIDRNVPFWDREIELVIMSHPQTDHFQGLIDVFKHYNVQNFAISGLDSGSQEFRALKSQVGGSATKVIRVDSSMDMRVGLIYLDILHPSSDFIASKSSLLETNEENVLGAYTSSVDPNEFSVVAVLKYKNFEAIFTGDIGPKTSELVSEEIKAGAYNTIEYIKIPHHGSKNGLTQGFLDAVNPEVAVISAGKNNSYGHPHKEVLDMLKEKGVEILRTDQVGDVIVESDGEKIVIPSR